MLTLVCGIFPEPKRLSGNVTEAVQALGAGIDIHRIAAGGRKDKKSDANFIERCQID
jgi:hypothetical protein